MVIFSYSRSRSQSTSLHDTLSQELMSVAEIVHLCKIVLIVLLAGIFDGGRKSCRFVSVPYDSVVNIQCAIELEQIHHRYQFSNKTLTGNFCV